MIAIAVIGAIADKATHGRPCRGNGGNDCEHILRRRPYGLDVAYGIYSVFGVSHGTEDSTQRTVSQGRTCGRCVLCRRAHRLCAKVPLALPLGPMASEFDPARRAAPAADAAMVGRSPGRVRRAPLGAAAERRAGRHVAGVFSQQLVRGPPRPLSTPPVHPLTPTPP